MPVRDEVAGVMTLSDFLRARYAEHEDYRPEWRP